MRTEKEMRMRQIELGNQGLVVSAQGLGCMGMSTTYGPSDEQENLSTLARALELGITLFDTAEVYGPYLNEELLARAFVGKRDKIVLATKVGFVFTAEGKLAVENGKPLVSGEPAHVRVAVEGSLRRLKTDFIDLLYLHRIDPNTPIVLRRVCGIENRVTHASLNQLTLDGHREHCFLNFEQQISPHARTYIVALEELGVRIDRRE